MAVRGLSTDDAALVLTIHTTRRCLAAIIRRAAVSLRCRRTAGGACTPSARLSDLHIAQAEVPERSHGAVSNCVTRHPGLSRDMPRSEDLCGLPAIGRPIVLFRPGLC